MDLKRPPTSDELIVPQLPIGEAVRLIRREPYLRSSTGSGSGARLKHVIHAPIAIFFMSHYDYKAVPAVTER